MTQTEIWRALPGSQTTVLAYQDVFELLYHGTRGPGKSETLLMLYASQVGKGYGPDWRGIIFRETHKQLNDLIKKSLGLYPRIFTKAKFTNSPNAKWVFEDGEELLLSYFRREEDYWNYHGHEYPFQGWDELCNWTDLVGYRRMMSCCRSSRPDMPRMIRSTANPYGPGHNAVKKYFELPAKDGIIRRRTVAIEDPTTGEIKTEKLTRLTVKGIVWENKPLLRAQPTYVAQIKEAARNEAEAKAWLEGDWNIVAGGMFDDVWEEKYNVVEPFAVPESWRIDRSFDWGSSAPFSVGWWAESDGTDYVDAYGNMRATVRGDLFRIGEWYGSNGNHNEGLRLRDSEIAAGIRERELQLFPDRRVKPGPADTQIYTEHNGESIAKIMAKPVKLKTGEVAPGVTWIRASKGPNSRIPGWQTLRERIKNAGPDEHGAREHPGLFVFRSCGDFINILPTLARSDKDLDEIHEQAEDHIADETRYRVTAASKEISLGRLRGTH